MAGWEEYNKLEPLGSYKLDFHFAHLCNLIFDVAQALGGSSKRRITKIMDFMPWWFRQWLKGKSMSAVKRQSPEELKTALMAWVGSYKKKDKQ